MIRHYIFKKLRLILFLIAIPYAKAYGEFTTTLGATSNYYSNGVSQTQNKPAANVEFKYNHKSGLYVKNWNSTISKAIFPKGYGIESDFYGGYKKEFTYFTADGGLFYYYYPGAKTPIGGRFNTKGFYYGAILGPLKLQLTQSLGSWQGTPHTDRTRYYESELNIPLHKKIKFNIHLGYFDSPLGRNHNCYDGQIGPIFEVWGGDLKIQYNKNILKAEAREENIVRGKKLYRNGFVTSYEYTFTF